MTISLPGVAEKFNLARGRGEQSLENFDGGCFASPVWSQQSEAFARAHFEIQSIDGADAAIVFNQAATTNGGRIVHARRRLKERQGESQAPNVSVHLGVGTS